MNYISYGEAARLDPPGPENSFVALLGNPVNLQELLMVACVIDLSLARHSVRADSVELSVVLENTLHF